MHGLLLVGLLPAILSLLVTPVLSASDPPPALKHSFTAHVTLGKPVGPIPVLGGYEIGAVEGITGGSVTGPAFAGTVAAGGASVIHFNSNFTLALPSVEIWGETDDGEAFFVSGTGVGKQGSQLARVIVSVGGKYAALENEFVLATFTDNKADPPTISTIEGWVGFGNERSLSSYCAPSEGINLIVIGAIVPILGKTYPSGLIGGECTVNEDGSSTAACSSVTKEIQTCQAAGVKIFIGFTNFGHNWGITSKDDASGLASALWSSYGADMSGKRPFGSVKVDGFDFDVELNPQNETQMYLGDLINDLRAHFQSDTPNAYYISGAPECGIPDEHMGNAMMQAKFDYIWIQFYNNYCSAADVVKNSENNPDRKSSKKNPGKYNLDKWPNYLAGGASSEASLFVGLPASSAAANSFDFITAVDLPKVIANSPGIGGVMLWNTAHSDASKYDGCTYAQNVAHVLSTGKTC